MRLTTFRMKRGERLYEIYQASSHKDLHMAESRCLNLQDVGGGNLAVGMHALISQQAVFRKRWEYRTGIA